MKFGRCNWLRVRGGRTRLAGAGMLHAACGMRHAAGRGVRTGSSRLPSAHPRAHAQYIGRRIIFCMEVTRRLVNWYLEVRAPRVAPRRAGRALGK